MGIKKRKQCKYCFKELKLPKQYMRKVSCIHCIEINDIEKNDYTNFPQQIAKEW